MTEPTRQPTLLDELDRRQDEVIEQLDELNVRVEQMIAQLTAPLPEREVA